MRMDGQTGVTKLIIAFHSFAKGPRKTQVGTSIHTAGIIRANVYRVRVAIMWMVSKKFRHFDWRIFNLFTNNLHKSRRLPSLLCEYFDGLRSARAFPEMPIYNLTYVRSYKLSRVILKHYDGIPTVVLSFSFFGTEFAHHVTDYKQFLATKLQTLEYSSLLWYDAVSIGKQLPTFEKKIAISIFWKL
jgi:hypothetical protein